ncbi:MAG: DUF3500 domain-containing protein [Deltaproteobacteria bacterium]|nr:DUF3500 domain-containing protein [Deltaproteobacteria bacterium]
MNRRDFCLTAPLAASIALAIQNAAAQDAERQATQKEARDAIRMKQAARVFWSSLSLEQRQKLSFPLNANQRVQWSNLPAANVPRVGVRIGDLDDDKRRLVHALMRASTSSQGYLKISGIMQHDDVFRAEELAYMEHNQPKPRVGRASVESTGSGSYWIAFFGDPTSSDSWAWLLTGHHLAATFTLANGHVTFMPLFVGSAPNEIQRGAYAGARVLSHEASLGYELLHSLAADQLRVAVLSPKAINDVMTGPGRQASLTTFEGIPASALNARQQRLIWALIEEYVRNASFDAADAQLDAIKAAGLSKLYFSWRGPVDDPDAPYYYRVHGPRIIIEYAEMEPNHVHTITRDPAHDYGADWLGIHYQEHAASPRG